MNKKAIAILGAIFLLIVGTLGFLIYSKYASKQTTDNTQNTQTQVPDENNTDLVDTQPDLATTTLPASNIVKVVDDQVVSPALFYNGKGVTYFDNQGNLYQVSFADESVSQSKKQLDIPVKANISKILWPAKGNDFIAEFSDPAGKKSWSYFNSAAGSYTDLPVQVDSVDWMPSGTQIMYIWLENGKATLNISDPDTKNWTAVAEMWETDNKLNISPDGQQVLYYETKNIGADNAINLVSADGKVWKGMVKSGFNFGVLWSPDGQKFMFAKKDPATQKYQLWVYNMSSGEIKNLGLFTTTEKTVWDKDSNIIYAAVPDTGTIGENSLTADSFYRMDVSTLERKQYPSISDSQIDGRDLFLDSLGNKLFFKNAQDGSLYYLDLTK